MARSHSLSTTLPRWLVAVFSLALLSLFAGGAWFFLVQRHHLRLDAESDLEAIARLKSDQISRWRAERLGNASVLSANPSVPAALSAMHAGAPETEALQAILRAVRDQYGYRDVLTVDGTGVVRTSLIGDPHPLSVSAQRVLEASFRERRVMFTDLHPDPLTSDPHIDVIAPIFHPGDDPATPVGAIVLCCDAADFLFPLIEEWPTASTTAETLLVERAGGDVLYLNELRHRNGTALRLRIPLSRTDTPAVQAVLGLTGIYRGRDYRDVEVVAAILPVPGSPWFIVAKEDAVEVLATWRLSAGLILSLLLGLALAAAVGAGLLWQRIEKERLRTLLGEVNARETSEERYRMTLLSVGDGVIATDAGSAVQMMNQVAEEMTGWKLSEAVGRPLDDVFTIVHEETRAAVENPVRRVVREGKVIGLANHTLLISRDGSERSIEDSGAPIRGSHGGIEGVVLVFRDATEERRHRREREITLELLRVLNSEHLVHDLIRHITGLLQRTVGCDAVGIRLRDGDDYPYAETRGFSPEFVRLESTLCTGGDGEPSTLACMCGNVLQGRFDPARPYFTPKGTFWTNSTTSLLATATENEGGARIRNRCNGEGFESVGLVPLRHGGQVLGLLQFNDRAKNRFTPELLAFLENVADQVAVALSQRQMASALAESEEHYRSLFEHMLNGFAFCRMIYARDRPVDFIYLEVNRAFENLTGLRGVAGRRVSEVIPTLTRLDRDLIEAYDRVARTGVPERFEMYVRSMSMWFSVAVYSPRRDHFVAVFDVITERKQAEAGRLLLASAIDQADEMVVITDSAGIIQYVNPAFERVTGFPRDEVVGRVPHMVKRGETEDEAYRALQSAIESGTAWKGRLRNRRRDGTVYSEDFAISPVHDAAGAVVNFVSVGRDITRESLLEEQLHQAQKMESVGRLAGGVAHDFNNMLHVIVNCVERALQAVEPTTPLRGWLQEIRTAARRSVDLTGQLLAFARKQTISPRVLTLDDEISGMTRMLRRLIGEGIDLGWTPGTAPRKTRIDPAQLNQILANLVINARDAIGGVGRIHIGTEAVALDEAHCIDHPDHLPGEYLVLSVTDTGCGMDRKVKEHLFEPFFTTKPVGEGTGLGLATVYGIVRQNNGFIEVASEPGRGSTFRIHLPLARGGESPERAPETSPAPARGTGTILVVEDEEAILTLSRMSLEELGYRVIAKRDPEAAIEYVRSGGAPVDLLITDVVMPNMDGRELAAELARLRPRMRFLFMSGYTANVIARQGLLEEGMHFLAKPFELAALAAKVREILDG